MVGFVLLAVLLCGCAGAERGGRADPWPVPSTGASAVALTADQRRVADQLVSLFENSTLAPRYDYVADLADGRGYTCGRIGFTTSSTEVRDVVDAYVQRVPGAALARHLPRLRELAAAGNGDTTGLAGFPGDWSAAAADPVFRSVQDAVVDRIAFDPATAAARRLGIRTPLGVAILYDTAVQHGTAEDPDGLPALVTRAGRAAGGDPAGGVAEKKWLTAFLRVREDALRNAHEPATRQVWAESVGRVQALRGLVGSDRHRLSPPLPVRVWGEQHTLR